MPKRELEAVLAHEVVAHPQPGHVPDDHGGGLRGRHRPASPTSGFRAIAYGGRSRKAGALVRVLAVVGFILAPYAALLLRMSLSRRREFLADAGAAEILNDPEAMALALRRLELDPTTVRYADSSTAHLWVESPTDRVDWRRSGVLELSSLVQHSSPHLGADRRPRAGRRVPAARTAPDGRAVCGRAGQATRSLIVKRGVQKASVSQPKRVDNGRCREKASYRPTPRARRARELASRARAFACTRRRALAGPRSLQLRTRRRRGARRRPQAPSGHVLGQVRHHRAADVPPAGRGRRALGIRSSASAASARETGFSCSSAEASTGSRSSSPA